MNADGSDARPLGSPTSHSADHPSWSADGRRIVFVEGGVDELLGASGRLVTVDARGGHARRLPVAGAGYPAWSPDGTQIAFDRGGNGVLGAYVVRVDGRSKPRLLLRGAMEPAWSPDGTRLAASKGVGGLWIVPAAGGRPGQLPIDVGLDIGIAPDDLAWSPDGARLAFTTSDALYVAELRTGKVHRIASIRDA